MQGYNWDTPVNQGRNTIESLFMRRKEARHRNAFRYALCAENLRNKLKGELRTQENYEVYRNISGG